MARHPPYKECPDCGANLDPGERCDCTKKDSAAHHGDKAQTNEYITILP